MGGRRSQSFGFTLVELFAVLAIVGVLLGLAVPGFQRLTETTRLRSQTQQMFSDILFTRSEAIKRNRPVVMCPSQFPDGGERACGGGFRNGWVIFPDLNNNRQIDPGEPVLRRSPALREGLSITNRAATVDAAGNIAYLADGSSRRNRTLMFCSAVAPEIESFSIVMNIVGRPRTARGWGECPG